MDSARPSWSEHVVDGLAPSVAERLADSMSVVSVPAFASAAECEALLCDATAVAEGVRSGRVASERAGTLSATLACRLEQPSMPSCVPGRVRLPVAGLAAGTQALCSQLLLRALDLVEKELPATTGELFGSGFVAELHASSEPLGAASTQLKFTHNEPAINVYDVGGEFSPHKDLQSLTVLVPLVGAESHEGGGTAFWPRRLAAEAVTSDVKPTLVLRPPAGTALLFGGELTHAGLPVTAGHRAVLVASFSRRCAPAHEGCADGSCASCDAAAAGVPVASGDDGAASLDEDSGGARRSLERALLEQLYGPEVT